jgi:hypothetical protein
MTASRFDEASRWARMGEVLQINLALWGMIVCLAMVAAQLLN